MVSKQFNRSPETPVRRAPSLLLRPCLIRNCCTVGAGTVALQLFSVPSLRKDFWHHRFECAVLLRPLRLLKLVGSLQLRYHGGHWALHVVRCLASAV